MANNYIYILYYYGKVLFWIKEKLAKKLCLAFDPKGSQWMSRSGEWRRPSEAEWLGSVPVKETQSSVDPGEGGGETLGSHINMETSCTFPPTIAFSAKRCGYRGIIVLSTDTTLSDTSEGNKEFHHELLLKLLFSLVFCKTLTFEIRWSIKQG